MGISKTRESEIQAHKPKPNEKIGLPYRPFLFTLDQISSLLNVEVSALMRSYIYFDKRSTGIMSRDLMLARNIAPRDSKPEWRVAERELLRWMKRKGFKHYEPTALQY
jgi:hypothetical protein